MRRNLLLSRFNRHDGSVTLVGFPGRPPGAKPENGELNITSQEAFDAYLRAEHAQVDEEMRQANAELRH